MAITLPSNFKLVNDLFETGYSETITQAVDDFFNASNGAVVKESVAFQGDYAQHNYFKAMTGLVSRRTDSATDAAAAADPVTLSEGGDDAARLKRIIGPIDVTMGAMRARNFSVDVISRAIGVQVAKAEMADQINSAAASLVGALSSATGASVDLTATAFTTKTLTHSGLVEIMQLAGDTSNDIAAWLMPSKAFFQLVKQAIDPTKAPDMVGTTAIYGGTPGTFGRPVIVTDSPALTKTVSAGTTHYIAALKPGAIQITVDELPTLIEEAVTGKKSLAWRVQGELDYLVRILGYAYKQSGTGAGGANPADSSLAASAAWSLDSASIKSAAGFLGEVND